MAEAPSSAPLSTGAQGGAGAAGGEETAGGTPQSEADPLVSNGLGSPSCRGALASELSVADRRDCETSGFAAAPAPTADYGIDVHIDNSVLNPGSWGTTIVQDLFVTPLWMGLVWAVHALVVMLEWSFTIDLLDSAAAAGVGSGLRQMQATFTAPWLALALAVASVLALYHGLVRRRVADTLGEVLLMVAMMVAGIWIATDPTGTVGALGAWANQASLGTLAVAAQGNPSSPGRALDTSLEKIFATAIEVPWCYLEFGDVGWCREPSRIDPQLRAAALKIAAQQVAQLACEPSSAVLAPCASAGSAETAAVAHSSELLRAARTNGGLFLALPANGPARNSINDEGSLLRVLCQSDEATSCRGPTAAQAEFRTSSGTLWRIGGVLLIAAGLLGMLLLVGFVAIRLLMAAVFSLLYLLLAPAMVLAPAFGDGGRSVFRRWAARLLAAVVSKLVFSFLLGVVFAVIWVLARLNALGWWTQWLLMSSFWWGAFAHRHHALGLAEGAVEHHRPASGRLVGPALARRVGGAIESNQILAAARRVKARKREPGPDVQRRNQIVQAGRRLAQAGGDEQVRRALAEDYRAAGERARQAPSINRGLSAKRTQLERLGRERDAALALGDRRRAAKLSSRESRVRGEVESEQASLNRSRQLAGEGERLGRRKGSATYARERMDEQRRFLDAQAALPAAARARGAEQRRDYAALAALAGYRRGEYERLDPPAQRAARLEIDRELALRKELSETARDFARDSASRLGRRDRRRVDRGFDGALAERMRDGGHQMPASRETRSPLEQWRRDGARRQATAERTAATERSSVMDDARGGRATQTPARQGSALTGWPAGQRAIRNGVAVRVIVGAGVGCALMAFALVAILSALGGASLGAGGVDASEEAGGEDASALAMREIPPLYLRLYEQAAARYGLDWAVLAGIGKVECDNGRDPDPACTQEGVVNSAGAGGPMQFIASTWARYGVDGDGDGRIDRWDPADAIYGAANYLHASGAPGNYRQAIFAYNHAGWYVAEVREWAARYTDPASTVEGGERQAVGVEGEEPPIGADRSLASETATPVRFIRGERAELAPDDGHVALIPTGVPAKVQAMLVAGNELQDLPYGPGGHPDPLGASEEDCSSTVNYVLYRAGIRPLSEIVADNPLAQDYVDWGAPGPGRWVTIYASAAPTPHVFIVIAGLRLDTSHDGTDVGPNRDESGPRWRILDQIPTWAHWSVRHPPGM